MRSVVLGAVVAGLTLSAAPASAQQADWWDWALREVVQSRGDWDDWDADRDDRGDWDDWDDDRYDRRDDRRSSGPPFCRNGRGHPVHGMSWCRGKGYDVGYGRYDRRGEVVVWEQRGWDVILPAPRSPRDPRRARIDRGGLLDILGAVVFGRLMEEDRRWGGRGDLSGRWVSPDGRARVLQIRSGSRPLAELSDMNGNGRVEAVLVQRR